ncbi:MAG: zf-HC2 domain-containing protein [Armatimonadetes bacterium]|nr:zf-HC2 domain-containing protein [Armatimonadota bacterium]
MNWRFWDRTGRAGDDCAAIEPLLSLYSDGMASQAEARRVDAHLETCADCRQALRWMQATHQVIAARPAMPPPADLRARIARAIAEADGVKAPVVRTPARPARQSLTLRPVLAYGLSVALLAAVTGGIYWNANRPINMAESPIPSRSPVPIAENTPSPTQPSVHSAANGIRPHIGHPKLVVAARPHHAAVRHIQRRPVVNAQPSQDRMASIPHDSDQANDDMRNMTLPVEHVKKTAILLMHRPTPLITHKPPMDMNRVAINKTPVEHHAVPAPQPPLAPQPPEHVATIENVPISHPYLPPVSRPVHVHIASSNVGPPVIHPDQPVVHEAEDIHSVLHSAILHMHQAALTSHSATLSDQMMGAAGTSSDRSGTVAITSGPVD